MTKADLTLIDHPLIQHKLTLMRDENTAAAATPLICPVVWFRTFSTT